MYEPLSNFSTEVIDNTIFPIGGFYGITLLYGVECYDEKSNEWFEAGEMSVYVSGLSACVVMALPNVYDYIH
jgi:kelch-like protein 10